MMPDSNQDAENKQEIVVTEAMVEAGLSALYGFTADDLEFRTSKVVESVIMAALAIKSCR